MSVQEIMTELAKLGPRDIQLLKAKLDELQALPAHPEGRQAPENKRACLVRDGTDVLLQAPPGAPVMTPENVKMMLQDWP